MAPLVALYALQDRTGADAESVKAIFEYYGSPIPGRDGIFFLFPTKGGRVLERTGGRRSSGARVRVLRRTVVADGGWRGAGQFIWGNQSVRRRPDDAVAKRGASASGGPGKPGQLRAVSWGIGCDAKCGTEGRDLGLRDRELRGFQAAPRLTSAGADNNVVWRFVCGADGRSILNLTV